MKKTFTKFLAALALLAFFIPSMIAVGQTKTVTYEWNHTDKTFAKSEATGDDVDNITTSIVYTGTSQSNYQGKTAIQLMSKNGNTIRGTFDFTLSDFPYEITAISFNYRTTSGNKSGSMSATLDGNAFASYTTNLNSSSSWSDQVLTITGDSEGGEDLVISANYTTNSVYVHSLTITYTTGGGGGTTTDPTITFNDGSVNVGKTLDLSTLFDSNSDGVVTYSIISGDSYASLEGSVITGDAEGSVTVKAEQAATSSYNAGEATATITVNAALTLSSIAITTAPTKTTYTEGETFDPTGMVVTATYSNSTTDDVTALCTFSPSTALTTTDNEITVSYTENAVTKTATQAITVYEVVDYATLPFSFNGGRADIENTDGLTQIGLGTDYGDSPKLKFDNQSDELVLKINETPGVLTFKIKGNGSSTWSGTFVVQTSVDGETYTTIASYTNLGETETKTIDNLASTVRYIKWYFYEKSTGFNVALGNIALAKYVAVPSISADDVDIDYNATGGSISFTVNNPVDGGAISASVTDGDWITLGTETTSPISFTCSANTGDERTATVRLTYTYNTNETKTKDVTITQSAAPAAPGNWVLTSLEQLTSSDVFVIVGNDGDTYALSNNNGTGSAPTAVAVNVVGNTLSGNPANNIKWNISGNATNGYTFYPDGTTATWLYCNNENNGVRVGTNNNKTFKMDHDYLKHTSTSRYIGVYNSSDWRCYTSYTTDNIKNQTFAFYKYVSGSIITQSIEGYDEGTDKWYLIASPVTSVASSSVAAGTYDLYRFNPTAENEWENYKNQIDHSDFTTLEFGRGYLYANKNDIQLSFVGTPNGSGLVNMPYEGWNLIGNPLSTAATITNPYYRINDDRTGVMAGEGDIAVMEGIFVHATEADQKVTFSTSEPGKSRNSNALVINLNRNDKVIDRAIVRFGESEKLSKFQLFEGSTKIYIPQNGKDYAIAAMDNNTQAFNLNFHAKTTGKYNISLGETSNLSYVHIFDRMTGEDVDMLLEDSYSFIGSPADSEERFIVRLSYNASSTSSETFAYQSGNGIIVNGEGTLEVYDVTGRKVMTTTINGVETINGLNSGVYVFRVIGETLRTQKIVVR